MSDTYALILAVAIASWTVLVASWDRRLWLAVLPHNAAWIVGCAVVGSGLMNYISLSLHAWTLITGAIIAFNMGVVLARRPGVGADNPVVGRGGPNALVSMRVYVFLLLCFLVGFLVYLRTIDSHYGLVTLVTDPSSIRAGGADDLTYLERFPLYGKLMFYLGPLCFVLTVCPDLVRGLREKPMTLRIALAVILTLTQVAALQRTNLFVSVLWAAGIILLQTAVTDRKPRRASGRPRLGVVVVLGLVGLLAFQGLAVALGKTGAEDRAIADSVDPAISDSPLLTGMHYAGGGIPAFGKLVDSGDERWPPPITTPGGVWGEYNPQTWGLATFSAPLKLVPGTRQWAEISPFTRLPAPTNVYTWLEPWYRDFRAPGAILGSLGIGWLIGVAANRAGRSPRLLVLGGLLLGLSAMAIFLNRYTTVMNIVLYATILWFGQNQLASGAAGPFPARRAEV